MCWNVSLCCTLQVSAASRFKGFFLRASVVEDVIKTFRVRGWCPARTSYDRWTLLVLKDDLGKSQNGFHNVAFLNSVMSVCLMFNSCTHTSVFPFFVLTHNCEIDMSARFLLQIMCTIALCVNLPSTVGLLHCYTLCLVLFYVCVSSLENLSVFCGRSGSLFKPMRVHYSWSNSLPVGGNTNKLWHPCRYF